MELSTYFNLDLHQNQDSEMSTFPHHQDESFYHLPNPNTFFDSHFDPTTFLNQEMYSNVIPCTSPYEYDPINSLNHIFPIEDGSYNNLLPCPKRQKCFYDQQEQSLLLPNLCSLQKTEELCFSTMPEYFFQVPPLPQIEFGANEDDQIKEKSVSPQSIAARERRRRITEKTQELGKLVPGGTKMNTAEMLNAAGKYVQFLQAQVEMLQLMHTLEEKEDSPLIVEVLGSLAVSSFLQEKMYSKEKCFVPIDFVTTLTNQDSLQSKPSILKDLGQLIGADVEKKAKQD